MKLENKNLTSFIVSALLIVGVVDQINGEQAVIEYTKKGRIMYSTVSLEHSACLPREGSKVYFFEDYKIVTCED